MINTNISLIDPINSIYMIGAIYNRKNVCFKIITYVVEITFEFKII